jgi:hypothetical protein
MIQACRCGSSSSGLVGGRQIKIPETADVARCFHLSGAKTMDMIKHAVVTGHLTACLKMTDMDLEQGSVIETFLSTF